MNGFEKFIVSIFDAITHGHFLSDHLIYEKTGCHKIIFEQMIDDINTGKKIVNPVIKNDPELYKMVTKSLALLVFYPHGKDNELVKYTGKTSTELSEILSKMWGKDISGEYDKILNQN